MKIFLFTLMLLLVRPLPAAGPFKVLGPVETIDNGVVTLDVTPKTGRIVGYQRKGEANWLANEDREPNPGWNWNPWGGDRVWPVAQFLNHQIYGNNGFDPVIDGQPWEVVKKEAGALTLRSGVSPQLGVRITRQIELVAGSAAVVHTFTIERVADSVFPVHIWTVTGVRSSDYMLVESDRRTRHAGWKPFKWWLDVSVEAPKATLYKELDTLHVPRPAEALKVGTYGRWIAAVSGSSAFVQTIAYEPPALYLEASNLQVFMNLAQNLHEIETLSPTWQLAKGESRTWQVRWDLVDAPSPKESPATVAQRAAALADRLPRLSR